MQIVFLLWPVLLLPVLLAWLTRSDRSSSPLAELRSPETPPATTVPTQKTSPHGYPNQHANHHTNQHAQRAHQQIQVLATSAHHHQSLFYRKAAQAAYQEMQDMPIDDAPEPATEAVVAASVMVLPPKTRATPVTRGASDNPLIRLG